MFALSSSVRTGVTCGSFSGGSYTGELPTSTLKYGTWIINKRNSGSISIECIDIDQNTIWSNSYSNGSWKDWKYAVTNSDNGYVRADVDGGQSWISMDIQNGKNLVVYKNGTRVGSAALT